MFIKKNIIMSKINQIQVSGTIYEVSDQDLNGYKVTAMTQTQYDQLQTKENNTIYLLTA